MRSPIVKTLSAVCLLATPVLFAQDTPAPTPAPTPVPAPAPAPSAPARSRFGGLFGRGNQAPAPTTTTALPTAPIPPKPAVDPAKTDGQVMKASEVPVPVDPNQIQPGTLVVPTDPIEPWLLTKDCGPFMVMARTFQGPEAERYALALAQELTRDYGLPAYIMRLKDFPMGSFIRNVPPNAYPYMKKAQVAEPEKTRTHDQAMVLVGNEKTLQDSLTLLNKVKHINPKCLEQMPGIYPWRKGLSTASRTTNPYVPAQDLYPGRNGKDQMLEQKDKMLTQMNAGPRSVYNCPGRYTLQIAEFTGRTVINPQDKDASILSRAWLNASPLRTAADDAERIAEALAKDKRVQPTGCQPYVYHDRTSSKVMIGSFNSPNDPKAVELRDTMLRVAVAVTEDQRAWRGVVIAPASYLTDLEDPNKPIKQK